MKVLHISTPLSWRGGERQILLLLRSCLQQGGAEHYLFCGQGGELAQRAGKIKGVHLVEYPKKRAGFDPMFAAALHRFAQKRQIDLIHAHDSHAHTAVYLASVLFGNSLPLVISRRVDFPVASSYFSRRKYLHRNVKAILCVSDAIRNIVARSLPNSRAAILTVYSGIDLRAVGQIEARDLQRSFHIPEHTAILLNAAALEDHKDYPTFIRTLAELRSRGRKVHGLIYGKGSLVHAIRNLAQELGMDEHLTLAGFDARVNECIAGADVFLFPSKMEGLGTVLLEALACGTPVVATRAGGIPELIRHGINGLLADVGDYKTLADQVELVLNDANVREKLIRGGSEWVQKFGADETARLTLQTYRKVLAENV